jgi:hypothetical protein
MPNFASWRLGASKSLFLMSYHARIGASFNDIAIAGSAANIFKLEMSTT